MSDEQPTLDQQQAPQQAKSDDTIEVSKKEFRGMQKRMAEMEKQFASMVAERNELLKETTGGVLPESEQPIYELSAPWFSPDDVYYYEGMVVTDVRGDIVPNEFMIPRNQPAQDRYDAYMAKLSQYGTGRQPTIFEIIDAASRVTRELGPTASGDQMQAAIMAAVIAKTGRPGAARAPGEAFTPPPRAVDRNNVPLMANTQITQQGVPQRPAPPKRGPVRTKQVGMAAEPTANVQGSVLSPPLSQQPA